MENEEMNNFDVYIFDLIKKNLDKDPNNEGYQNLLMRFIDKREKVERELIELDKIVQSKEEKLILKEKEITMIRLELDRQSIESGINMRKKWNIYPGCGYEWMKEK
jgi:hypothetical protein